MGRNRVCSISIPAESHDIIDLRTTARTVGETVLKSESITAFVGAISIKALPSGEGGAVGDGRGSFCILHSAFRIKKAPTEAGARINSSKVLEDS